MMNWEKAKGKFKPLKPCNVAEKTSPIAVVLLNH
jgi:hypothetical protein